MPILTWGPARAGALACVAASGSSVRARSVALAVLGVGVLVLIPVRAPAKQSRTNANIARGSEPDETVGPALAALERLEPGLRIARFGPKAYRYYPTFGRHWQFVPVATNTEGTPDVLLHDRWRGRGTWWLAASDTTRVDSTLAERLRANGVEVVLVARDGDSPRPRRRRTRPQRRAVQIHHDDHATLWRLTALGAALARRA